MFLETGEKQVFTLLHSLFQCWYKKEILDQIIFIRNTWSNHFYLTLHLHFFGPSSTTYQMLAVLPILTVNNSHYKWISLINKSHLTDKLMKNDLDFIFSFCIKLTQCLSPI